MRRTATVTITADGRDSGKRFKLTELPAKQAEKWATRAFLALARGGIDIPADIAESGLAGIALFGTKIFGSMKFEDAEPLLDEMMTCVEVQPDPANPNTVTPLFESSIEEISTLLKLRTEVIKLHVDFSQLAGHFASAQAASKAAGLQST